LQETKDFVQLGIDTKGDYPDGWFADTISSAVNRKDLGETQKCFYLLEAYPDLEIYPFAFSIDPKNPYRYFWFEKWWATHTVTVEADSSHSLPATGHKDETPVVA
jgi:hypothetical protein